MSRLRLAAACALLKLAQEPCYHEIITLEQYQLCALVINVRTSSEPSYCVKLLLSSDCRNYYFFKDLLLRKHSVDMIKMPGQMR